MVPNLSLTLLLHSVDINPAVVRIHRSSPAVLQRTARCRRRCRLYLFSCLYSLNVQARSPEHTPGL